MPAGVSAYVPLANVTTSSAYSTITFSSISQSYRDLVLVADYSTAGAGGTGFFGVYVNGQFNNGSYAYIHETGNGSTTSAGQANSQAQMIFSTTGTPDGGRCVAVINVFDYATSGIKAKTFVGRVDTATAFTSMGAARWWDDLAVTSISVRFSGLSNPAGGNFALYGVSA
jgi:hypothetical protein